MMLFRRRDVEQAHEELFLIDVVMADMLCFKSNARLLLKPRYLPGKEQELGFSPLRLVHFLPSFYSDLTQNADDQRHFRQFFDFDDEQLVQRLCRAFFQNRFEELRLPLSSLEIGLIARVRKMQQKIEKADLQKLNKMLFIARSFAEPKFKSNGKIAKLSPADRKGWVWLRSHKDLAAFCSNANRFSPRHFLIRNAALIFSLFSSGYCDLSIRQQLEKLAETEPEFAKVSATSYRLFIKQTIGICFAKAKVAQLNCDSAKRKEVRKLATLTHIFALNEGVPLFYFDETTVSQESFSTKVWRRRGLANLHIQRRASPIGMKLLLLISRNAIVNYWIVSRSSSEIVCSFFKESVGLIRGFQPELPIVIFLDNAMMHKTLLMQLFCAELQVYLLFNAPISSKSNPVEYLFERLKRVFRNRMTKNRLEHLGKTLHAECKKLTGRDAERAFELAMPWMQKAMQMQNFWLQ